MVLSVASLPLSETSFSAVIIQLSQPGQRQLYGKAKLLAKQHPKRTGAKEMSQSASSRRPELVQIRETGQAWKFYEGVKTVNNQ